jgi:hypothetical protein
MFFQFFPPHDLLIPFERSKVIYFAFIGIHVEVSRMAEGEHTIIATHRERRRRKWWHIHKPAEL